MRILMFAILLVISYISLTTQELLHLRLAKAEQRLKCLTNQCEQLEHNND